MTERTAAIAVPRRIGPENRTPPPPEPGAAPPFEVRTTGAGRAVFAVRAIAAGTRLFGEHDWADEEERRSFSTMSTAQFNALVPSLRADFLRYAYNTDINEITGAFRAEAVRHPVNFLNHSCEPNAGYDGAEHIVALTGIAAGEEIRMDYGTFTFSFDHDFACRCGAWRCRGKVTRGDWTELVRLGLRLPSFMQPRVSRALWG